MNNKRRFLVLLIACLLCAGAFTVSANAVAPTGTNRDGAITAELESEHARSSGPLDNDELFKGYIEEQLSAAIEASGSDASVSSRSDKRGSSGSRTRGSKLTGNTKIAYDKLKDEIAKVAAGERSSTEFVITLADLGFENKTWGAADLGVDAIVVDRSVTAESVAALVKELDINFDSLINALLADCPYEMYWYDKTVGGSMAFPGISVTHDGSEYRLCFVGDMTCSLSVAQGYSAGTYTVNTSNAQRVQTAVSNAASIVGEFKNYSDYNKLLNYKTRICSLVSYNTAAANDSSTPYGDPWQLISVFDGDTNTNVVCEGYSKAFQYLCDLTTFTDYVDCISVSGTMTGGTGAGAHMWNIVTMKDGKNYIVDVTNCDSGTIGAPDKLFLAGCTSGDKDTGYVYNCSGTNVTYTYKAQTKTDYGDQLLMADKKYEENSGDHVHVYGDLVPRVEPTCTANGMEAHYQCQICLAFFDADKNPTTESALTINATAHTYDQEKAEEAYLKSEADCTNAAVYYKSCACGEKGTETFTSGDPLGHKYGNLIREKSATCTEDGFAAHYQCSVCKSYFDADKNPTTESALTINATAHTYDQEKAEAAYLKTAADCTNAAEYYKSCKCGEKGTETFTSGDPLGHDYQTVANSAIAATCTADGKEADQECSRCHDVRTGTVITAKGHSYGNLIREKSPTCTEYGFAAHYQCSVCKLFFDANKNEATEAALTIDKTEHIYNQKKAEAAYLKTAADCTHAAEYYMSCQCGEKGTGTFTSGSALGHNYQAVAGSAAAATITEDGKEADQECSRCHDFKEGAVIPKLIDISQASVTVAKATYTGKALSPKVTVIYDGTVLEKGVDYQVSFSKNKNAGSKAVVTITGTGMYGGKLTDKFTIAKAANTLTVKAVKATQTANSGSGKTIKADKAFKVVKNVSKGKVTYKKTSGDKKITVSKTGAVTVAKGLKKGKTYTLKVKVTSAATTNYKSAFKYVTIKIKVK